MVPCGHLLTVSGIRAVGPGCLTQYFGALAVPFSATGGRSALRGFPAGVSAGWGARLASLGDGRGGRAGGISATGPARRVSF